MTDPIRALFEEAAKMKNPIDLSAGIPYSPLADSIKQAILKALENGSTSYTPTSGTEELKSEIKFHLKIEGFEPQAVTATSGAMGGLVSAFQVLVDPSTSVLVPDPYFIAYPPLVRWRGADFVPIDTYPTYRLSPDSLRFTLEKLDPCRKKVLLFNNPVNPTGTAYMEYEIGQLADVCRQHKIQVISDEVYNDFSFDFKHTPWGKFDPGAILIRSFGKSWGIPGWRLGYAAGPSPLIEAMSTAHQLLYVCPPSLSQWAGIAALKTTPISKQINFAARRSLIHSALGSIYKYASPQGAFFVFVEIPNGKSLEFYQECRANDLLVAPGEGFTTQKSYFRISYGGELETLKIGLEKLKAIGQRLNTLT